MFGSSGSTFGFGQQQQQQQQQPQPTGGGLFGNTGGAFGSTGFGASATPAFGQPAQQQPQSTGFGGFGATSAAPTFGSTASAAPAFGQPAQQQSGGLFGGGASTAAPSTGFSFGASNTGATSTFGQPAAAGTSGGLFGAAKPATTGFGGFGQPAQPQQPAATGGLFGGGAAAPAFGAAPGGQGNGTAVAPYQATTVMEPPAEEGKPPPTNQTAHQFQSITCMPQYKNYSFEELRFQDYQAGRKLPTAGAAPAFGSAFGASSTPAFGAAAPATGGGLFGASNTTTPAFGAASGTTNAFGSAPAAGGGLFGSAGATGAFGQPATSQPAASGGLFGQAASQPAQTGGLFGASAGTSTFGQPAATSTPAFGGFGAAAQKPATTGFSFGATNTTTPASSGGLFGSTPATSAPSNPFGQPAQPAATGGLFGQSQPAGQQPGAAPSFSFGAPAANKPLFGAAPATSAPAFGQSAAATAPKPTFSFGAAPAAGTTGGGLFGNTQQPAAAPAFGTQPAAQPSTGGLFGGGSTFGQPAQPAAGTSTFGAGGLFGAKPAQPATGGGLFGSTTAPAQGGGLFGSMGQQQQPQSTGLFGSSAAPAPQLGGSLFGGSQAAPGQQQQQQAAYASADDANAYGSNPLFASVGQSPVRPAEDKKKPPIFTAFRGTPVSRSSTKITRLRGFGSSSTSSPAPGGGLGASIGLRSSTASGLGGSAPGTPGGRGSPLRLVNGISDDVALSPNAFVSRPSVKKLVIDKKSLGKSLASPAPGTAPRAAKVTFNPEVQVPSRTALFNGGGGSARGSVAGDAPGDADASFVSEGGVTEGNTTLDSPSAARSVASELGSAAGRGARAQLKHGDYFTVPAIETLQKLPAAKLRAVPDLVVGRVGYGQVAFIRPVDLTTLPSVDELLGGLVRLEDRNATVYPEEFEASKPPPGEGLNVPATITLESCFPLDKATRRPITDAAHPRVAQHIKRLRNLEGTEFVDFDAEKGRWTFQVHEF
ncbi:hypothetical protein JCM10450v2_003995 [Rhodotorula kratochvilovae]